MGYGKVPEPISVLRRCILSSWHLQTVHTSDHCDLVVHGGVPNPPAQPALVHVAAAMGSAPINTVSERVRGYKELPSGRGSMPAAHIAQNQLSSNLLLLLQREKIGTRQGNPTLCPRDKEFTQDPQTYWNPHAHQEPPLKLAQPSDPPTSSIL